MALKRNYTFCEFEPSQLLRRILWQVHCAAPDIRFAVSCADNSVSATHLYMQYEATALRAAKELILKILTQRECLLESLKVAASGFDIGESIPVAPRSIAA